MKKYFLLSCTMLCLVTGAVNAQFKILLNFNITNGKNPYKDVTLLGSKLYGMTSQGGANGDGVIFSIDTDGTYYKDLLDFNGVNGENPYGSLTISGSKLYGMSSAGGANNDGLIFSIDTDGTHYKDLSDFNGTNGLNPPSSLTLSGNKLYGMTPLGGANNDGLVFSIDTTGNNYIDLFDFNGTNGEGPHGYLVLSKNKLYGMTFNGGVSDSGCIFSIDTNGSNYKDLLNFNDTNRGYYPSGSLTLSGNTLYGMTSLGGISGGGNIFSIDTNGSNYKDLFDMSYAEGVIPHGSLSLSGNILYGMTAFGGASNDGVIFSIDINGNNYTHLLDFNGTNGEEPNGSLTLSANKLYGMTFYGGAHTYGLIFSMHLPLSVTAGNIPLNCNGSSNGEAIAFTMGGIAPYTYLWSPGGQTTDTATGLSAGTYTITATDNLDSVVTASVVITQPLALSITFSPANILCNGGTGSATISASGGTSPYSYLWTPLGGNHATATGLTAGTYTVILTDSKSCTLTDSVTITEPSALTAIMGIPNNILCNGGTGSATISASGGTSPYSYLWTPSGGTNATGTGLTPGSYKVHITDHHGCVVDDSVIITQPSALTATIGIPANILCNGGIDSVMVRASGGISPYSYSWAPSGGSNATGTGLTAGIYTVTLTDSNNCTATASVTITQPPVLITPMRTLTHIPCNGGTGSVTVTVSGGTSPYSYLWTHAGGTSATNAGVMAGSYKVTVTDYNGCIATDSIIITQPSVLTATMQMPTNILCNGGTGSAMVTVSGGTSPYSYLWAPSGGTNVLGTSLTAGAYVVMVQDGNNCSATASVTITQPMAMVITKDSINVNSIGACDGGASVSVSGGTTPYIYTWSPGGGTNDTISGKCAGQYCCAITDNNGCKDSICVTILNTTGIDNITANSEQITVYPNPSNGLSTFNFNKSISGTIEIYDILGRKIYQQTIQSKKAEINLGNEPDGMYFYRAFTDAGALIGEGKMVVQK